MSEQQPINSWPPLSDVVDAGADTAQHEPGSVREVFRARNRVTVSVFERPEEYRVVYSLGDIHRLTFLSHEERTAVEREWHTWHRTYARLGRAAFVAWIGAAALASVCWWGADAVVSALGKTLGVSMASEWSAAAAVAIAVALIVTLPRFLASLAAAALCDSYLRGYADGVTRGVHRALRITPDVEDEMWNELRDAQRIDADLRAGAVERR